MDLLSEAEALAPEVPPKIEAPADAPDAAPADGATVELACRSGGGTTLSSTSSPQPCSSSSRRLRLVRGAGRATTACSAEE